MKKKQGRMEWNGTEWSGVNGMEWNGMNEVMALSEQMND